MTSQPLRSVSLPTVKRLEAKPGIMAAHMFDDSRAKKGVGGGRHRIHRRELAAARGSGYGSGNQKKTARIVRRAARSHARLVAGTCKTKIAKRTHFGRSSDQKGGRAGRPRPPTLVKAARPYWSYFKPPAPPAPRCYSALLGPGGPIRGRGSPRGRPRVPSAGPQPFAEVAL